MGGRTMRRNVPMQDELSRFPGGSPQDRHRQGVSPDGSTQQSGDQVSGDQPADRSGDDKMQAKREERGEHPRSHARRNGMRRRPQPKNPLRKILQGARKRAAGPQPHAKTLPITLRYPSLEQHLSTLPPKLSRKQHHMLRLPGFTGAIAASSGGNL